MIVYGSRRGAYRIVNGPAPTKRTRRPETGIQARVAAMIERRAADPPRAVTQPEPDGIETLERALGLR